MHEFVFNFEIMKCRLGDLEYSNEPVCETEMRKRNRKIEREREREVKRKRERPVVHS